MPKTDWEACFREAMSYVAMPCDGDRENLTRNIIHVHTRRTEEDLPRNAWHLVKGPDDHEWNLVYFGSEHRITLAFTLDGYTLDRFYYCDHLLSLKIGPEIKPLEE